MKPKITILFGEMGGGKNYWGKLIAKQDNATFFDGDTVATPVMKERVSKFKPLNREIIKDYINILFAEIEVRADDYGNLVVAQALYNDEDRKFLAEMLTGMGYNVQFYWIKTPFWRNLRQIWSRPNGFRWVLYWLMNKPFFEKPTHKYRFI